MTLEQLIERCKGSVYLTANPQRSDYQTVRQWMVAREADGGVVADPDETDAFDAVDQLIELQFYPQTPVGFYVVFGCTVDAVLASAEALLAVEDAGERWPAKIGRPTP